MKILVASKNPVKINAVKNGFKRMFPTAQFDVSSVGVPSDVSNQPIGDRETYEGAYNRASNAKNLNTKADLYIGIEGGVAFDNEEMQAFAWVVVLSSDQLGKARTSTFYLPKAVARLVKEGKELGEADDIIFNQHNSKQAGGAIGILTKNVIDRTQYYAEAVVLAMIPFKNTNLY